MAENPYWIVWCEDGGSPTVKHDNYPKAESEAKRLARANPGARFSVLRVVRAFEKVDVQAVEFEEYPEGFF